jgi:hypothetical protein
LFNIQYSIFNIRSVAAAPRDRHEYILGGRIFKPSFQVSPSARQMKTLSRRVSFKEN